MDISKKMTLFTLKLDTCISETGLAVCKAYQVAYDDVNASFKELRTFWIGLLNRSWDLARLRALTYRGRCVLLAIAHFENSLKYTENA